MFAPELLERINIALELTPNPLEAALLLAGGKDALLVHYYLWVIYKVLGKTEVISFEDVRAMLRYDKEATYYLRSSVH